MGDVSAIEQVLGTADYLKIVIGVLAALAIFKFVCGLIDYIVERTGITTKSKLAQAKRYEELERHDADIAELKQKDEAIETLLEEMQHTIDDLAHKFDDKIAKDDATHRARIKDRISEAYQKYHEKRQWTSMEREAFYDLIKSYEEHGGKNSFVHSTCEPESYTWKVID